jgi:hypothetical protein
MTHFVTQADVGARNWLHTAYSVSLLIECKFTTSRLALFVKYLLITVLTWNEFEVAPREDDRDCVVVDMQEADLILLFPQHEKDLKVNSTNALMSIV